LFFTVGDIKTKPQSKRFKGYSYTVSGEKTDDDFIKEIITSIYANNNPNDPAFHFKSFGGKNLSIIFKDQFGIIVNHKKIYRMRKELGFTRPYKDHFEHSNRRPNNHEINSPNAFWVANNKFIPTKHEGFVPLLDIIDTFDKTIVSTQIGHSSKSKIL